MAKFCSNCGNKVNEKDNVCSNCGNVLKQRDENVNVQNVQEVQPVQQNVNNYNNQSQGPSNGLAIAGFVVSLVSLICCGGAFGIIGLVLSVLGSINAKKMNGNGQGLATAGIVLGVISLVFFLFVLVWYFFIFLEYVA